MVAGNWKRKKFFLLAGVLVLGAAAVWLLRAGPSDRRLIEDLLRRGEHGIVAKNSDEIMSCIAPDYRDHEHVSYAQLRRMVFSWPRVADQGQLTIQTYQLEIGRERATGTLEAIFEFELAGSADAPAPAPHDGVRETAPGLASCVVD